MEHKKSADKIFFGMIITLALGGFFVFISAAMGLLARDGAQFESVLFSQAFFGLFCGFSVMILLSRIDYRRWRNYAPWVFIFSALTTALVFVPGIGFEHGGATRWMLIGPISFQPSEFLKIGVVLVLAWWFSSPRGKADSFMRGFLPFMVIATISGALLLFQPDFGTYISIATAATGIFIIAGCKWRHFSLLFLIAVIVAGGYAMTKPHALDRVMTFIDPARDASGSGWQIQQSLIAAGSGGLFGRGFGQSVQKFGFLPEPMGDSIFAVASEEFGLLGATIIVASFIFFLSRGLSIARRAPDRFGGLLVSGIVIMIGSQAFLNMGAIMGILPLTGVPLPFISHGGTALFFTLGSVGLILNVSRYVKR